MSGLTVRFLSREDVVRAGGENMAMVIEAEEEALRLHARGETVLPSKSVLRWGPPESELTTGRINVMPAYVDGSVRMAGIKWIGSNPANLGVVQRRGYGDRGRCRGRKGLPDGPGPGNRARSGAVGSRRGAFAGRVKQA